VDPMDRSDPPSSQERAEAASWVAKSMIREVIHRYLQALDTRDASALSACFADQVTIRSMADADGDGGVVYDGSAAEVSQALTDLANASTSSVHTCANLVQRTADTSADVLAYATATHAYRDKPGEISIRGLRYQIQLVSTDGDWRIRRLVHHALWEFHQPESAPSLPLRD
jgi:ketosteroid isomerase-like protein